MLRKQTDIWNAFFGQRLALIHSCALFDAGNMFEAQRIANAAIIIAGASNRNHTSLVDALGIAGSMSFRTTGEGAKISGLVHYQLEKIGQDDWVIHARPALQTHGLFKNVPHRDWLDQIVYSSSRKQLSRHDILRIILDKDGGAHFDKRVTDELLRDFINGDIGVNMRREDGAEIPIPWGVQNMVRQIGEELISTIRFTEKTFNSPISHYQWLEGGRFDAEN